MHMLGPARAASALLFAGTVLVSLAPTAFAYLLPKSFKGCPSGHYPRTFYGESAIHCSRCPNSKYALPLNKLPCRWCPKGKSSAVDRGSCWTRKHWNDCPPGTYGPNWKLKSPCLPCPPGRFSDVPVRTALDCKLCRKGRFGEGGSVNAECTGPCLERRLCGPGASRPSGGALCPVGKYELHIKKPHPECSLIAPVEFRPKAGYRSAWGEQGACVLDKAYQLVDLLFAWKECRAFVTNDSDSPCFANLLKTLEVQVFECCDGQEVPATGKQQKVCEDNLAPFVRAIHRVRAHFHNTMEPRSLWLKDEAMDKKIVLPVFQAGLSLAMSLYDSDPARWGLRTEGDAVSPDLTPLAHKLLHDAVGVDSVKDLFDIVEKAYYCHEYRCTSKFKAAEELRTQTKAPVLHVQQDDDDLVKPTPAPLISPARQRNVLSRRDMLKLEKMAEAMPTPAPPAGADDDDRYGTGNGCPEHAVPKGSDGFCKCDVGYSMEFDANKGFSICVLV